MTEVRIHVSFHVRIQILPKSNNSRSDQILVTVKTLDTFFPKVISGLSDKFIEFNLKEKIMSKREINIWIKSTDSHYMKRFTGIKTDKGLEAFRQAFSAYIASHALPVEASLLTVLKGFKASL